MKLKLELMQMTKNNMADVVTCIGVAAILSVIVFTIPNEIPIGEMAYQKLWLGRMAVVFVVCSLLSLCLNRKQYLSFPAIVTWVLIALGGIEAAWGMRQIYGLAVSNHSLAFDDPANAHNNAIDRIFRYDCADSGDAGNEQI